MGKDISGTGMDTNVINRFRITGQDESGEPRITAIAVMSLTPATHGNAMGIGNADYIPARVLAAIDFESTYTNALTAGQIGIQRPRIPTVLADGRDAIRAALSACGAPPGQARLAWIRDTLHTEVMGVSPALLAAHPDQLEVVHGPAPLRFDAAGELEPLVSD
jgi:hypothetical protein